MHEDSVHLAPISMKQHDMIYLFRGRTFALFTLLCLVSNVSSLDKVSYRETARTLTDTGLGSKIHLLDMVDNPFESLLNSNLLEAVPSHRNEFLSQEPVPPEFRNRQSFGQFSLASSFSQETRVELDEMHEVDALNRVVGEVASPHIPHVNVLPNALYETIHAYSGPSSVDFPGACTEGYVPFSRSISDSIEACWNTCRLNFACTQVHFNSLAQSCMLSHGISTRPSGDSSTTEVCRTLTPAGVATLSDTSGSLGLPAFELLPNNRVLLVYNGTHEFVADSLAECQSACLQISACSFGTWEGTACKLGHDIVPIENSVCPLGAECVSVCGAADCLLFVRNVDNQVSLPGLLAVPANRLIPTSAATKLMSNTVSCEVYCGSQFGSEDPCLTFCLADKRALCQGACASLNTCQALAFQYGNGTEQFCTGFTALPNTNVSYVSNTTSNASRIVEVYVPAPFALGAIPKLILLETRLQAMRKTSFLGPTDVRPQFSTFSGPCAVFHEMSIFGTGAGLTRFSASSLDECWSLCVESCSQVHYYPSSQECVLGDSIATTLLRTDTSVVCRTADYMPTQGSFNGLSGMMYVDASPSWFPNADDPVWFASIEECQTYCKRIDDGTEDSACRLAGYVDCSSFHATLCHTSAHPDCGLCDANPTGGVCRVTKPTAAIAETPVPCIGGQCRWFEKGALGYQLVIKTAANAGNVDFGASLFCEAASYLPPSAGNCSYRAESLWHCQSLCDAVNRLNGSGHPICVGGLYQDEQGSKLCRLAQAKLAEPAVCTSANCAWFELAGIGHTAGLELTGMEVASNAREISVLPAIIAQGACMQFKALKAAVTKSPAGFVRSPAEDCALACAFFPQCMAFQLSGSAHNGDACDVQGTDCTFITCTMSSALTLIAPTTNNSTMCYSKTPSGTVEIGPASVDMDGVDPGIPGFVVMNSRVRKFGFDNIINMNSLVLVPTLEECQSLCRTTDGCKTGNWQPCQSIEQYCPESVTGPQELIATCNACRNVALSEQQPSAQFPANLGVCKLADAVGIHSEGCYPEPCYSFEAGLDDFYILSMTKSPFLLPTGQINPLVIKFRNVLKAYTKTVSLAECQTHCQNDIDCKYGHFAPRTTGFGECYLSGSELRIYDGENYQLKDPVACEGTCLVFIKLPTLLPEGFGR